jgi:hypothetical protein
MSLLDETGLARLWGKVKSYVTSRSQSLTQAEYDALTPAQKSDGTVYYITDAISTEESELWSRVGRGTLYTDAQVISNAVNELKENIDTNTDDISTNTDAISELNSSLANVTNSLNPSDWQYQYVNLNDLKTTGLYTVYAGGNSPFGSTNNYFMVFVLAKQNKNDTIVQFAFRNNQFYFRMYFSGAWLNWASIVQ